MRKPLLKIVIGLGMVLQLAPGCATTTPVSHHPGPPLTSQGLATWAFFAGQLADQEGDFNQAIQYYRRALAHDSSSLVLRRYLVGDLIRLERFHEARLEYRSIIDQNPGDRETQFVLGQLYEAAGDLKVAERLYRAAAALSQEDSAPHTKLGILLLKQENKKEGLALLRKAVKINPSDREARRVLVNYYLTQNRQPAAEALLRAGLKSTPEDIEWLSSLARLVEGAGRREEAAELYLRLSQLHPRAPDSHRFLSIYYLKHNDWEGAILQLERLLKINPRDLLARRNLGLALYKQREYQQARQQLGSLVDSGLADALTHYLLGSIYRKQGLDYLAVDEFRTAVKLDWELVEAHLSLASVLLKTGEIDEAAAVMREASAKFSNIPQVHINHGLVLLRQSKVREALRVFQRARRLSPDNAAVHFHLGRAYLELDAFPEAVRAWKKTVQLNPDFSDAYNFLGYTHAERGLALNQALRWLRQALAREPENGYFLDSLGWIYYQQGKYTRALKTILEAVKQLKVRGKAVDAVIYDHLGDVYLKLQRRTEAEEAWQSALSADPGNEDLKRKLKQLKNGGG